MDTNATRDGTGLADLATASVLIGTDSLPLLSADEDISRCYPQLFAYFAQFALDVPCVAMVTASHNDNGWTGVKMGANRPLTFGPLEMKRLKDIVLGALFKPTGGGEYVFVENFAQRYIADLTNRGKLKRKLKVVAACGNGTAGAFAPQVLRTVGCEVIELEPSLTPCSDECEWASMMPGVTMRPFTSTTLAASITWSRTFFSSIDSASSFFSRRFSSSNWRRRFASLTSMPPYFDFQLYRVWK